MHIKKGDTVIVLSGDDKGKTGKVVLAFPTKNKVLVEGVNVMKKHERTRSQGGKGQVIERAMPIHVSKVRSTDAAKKAAKPAAKKAPAKK
ncbi:MAG TPA: 50S ribosomal protein L24 [Candidatus Paceibacterota bacterium]